MDRKSVVIGVLSFLCVVLLFSTVLIGLAYSNADGERDNLKNEVSDLNSSLSERVGEVSRLESLVSDLERNNSGLKSDLDDVRAENRLPMVYTDSLSWAMEDENVVANLNVYNFGDTTSEDVALTFATFEESDSNSIKDSYTLSAGNLAGESANNVDYEFEPDFDVGADDTAAVWIKECANECLVLSEEVSLIGKSAY